MKVVLHSLISPYETPWTTPKRRPLISSFGKPHSRRCAGRIVGDSHRTLPAHARRDLGRRGRFSLAQFKEDEAYTRATKTALRTLLNLLAVLLQPEAQASPLVSPDTIRQRIEPMVNGLVQAEWRDVVLREITARTFILNLPGTRKTLSSCSRWCWT